MSEINNEQHSDLNLQNGPNQKSISIKPYIPEEKQQILACISPEGLPRLFKKDTNTCKQLFFPN